MSKSMSLSTKRNSNIELLRIIAMLIIVAHHFSLHGGYNFSLSEISINRFWIQFIQIGGKIGVNVFILISGYFLVTAKQIRINKALKLWLQVFTYSAGIFILFVALDITPLGLKSILNNFLPLTYSRWWFASAYFILYLISPYINKLLIQLTNKDYLSLIVLTTICWVLIPTLSNTLFQSNNLIWFIYLYTVSGYIKLHLNNINISGKKYILMALILIVVTFLSVVAFDFIGLKISLVARHTTYFYDMQKLPIFLISLFLFIGFLNTKIKYNKIINLLASATFGVYLIHDNYYVRSFLWETVFKNASFSNSVYLIPYSLVVIVGVYLGCTLIELFRIYIIEKNYLGIIDKFSNFLCGHFNGLINYMLLKFGKNA